MATEEQMQQLADEAIADLKDPLAAIGRLNEKVVRLEAANEGLRAALRRYGGHGMDCNWTRFERGECACGFAAALSDTQTGTAGGLEVRERLEKQIDGQKRTLHKLKGKWNRSQLRVQELERLIAGLGVKALDETCAALAALRGK